MARVEVFAADEIAIVHVMNRRFMGARCSNKGFLPMSTADYLSLLDWTARQTRSGKRGSTPKQFAPLFDRLGISA